MAQSRKREIFIKIENIENIISKLKDLKEKQQKIGLLLKEYDKLTFEENKIFENWSNYLEDINQKIEHLSV